MPNWVYNGLTVRANNRQDLDAFIAKSKHDDREFSFWNFVTPPKEALESGEYYGERGWSKDNGETGNTPNNWYNFNYREWGTKWDACNPSPYDTGINDAGSTEDAHEYSIHFETAWSHPEPVFKAISEQHPELEFDFSWEEEQGWGGAAKGSNGKFVVTHEYDIPNSHAEYVEREREDSCNCMHSDDQEYWYADCPREEEPLSELEQNLRNKIIEGSGVSEEWAEKHLIVSVVK